MSRAARAGAVVRRMWANLSGRLTPWTEPRCHEGAAQDGGDIPETSAAPLDDDERAPLPHASPGPFIACATYPLDLETDYELDSDVSPNGTPRGGVHTDYFTVVGDPASLRTFARRLQEAAQVAEFAARLGINRQSPLPLPRVPGSGLATTNRPAPTQPPVSGFDGPAAADAHDFLVRMWLGAGAANLPVEPQDWHTAATGADAAAWVDAATLLSYSAAAETLSAEVRCPHRGRHTTVLSPTDGPQELARTRREAANCSGHFPLLAQEENT